MCEYSTEYNIDHLIIWIGFDGVTTFLINLKENKFYMYIWVKIQRTEVISHEDIYQKIRKNQWTDIKKIISDYFLHFFIH